jgi:hypothetical protein
LIAISRLWLIDGLPFLLLNAIGIPNLPKHVKYCFDVFVLVYNVFSSLWSYLIHLQYSIRFTKVVIFGHLKGFFH